MFLNQRPQSRPCRGSGNVCTTCDRGLQDPYVYCSLSCKVLTHFLSLTHFIFPLFLISPFSFLFFLFQLQHILSTDPTRISDYIFNCEHLTLPEPGLDDGQMTPESVLEPAGSLRTSSGSSGAGGIGCLTLGCTATTEVVVRKKRSNVSGFRPPFAPVSEISAGLLSRRKGTPQRSPLH